MGHKIVMVFAATRQTAHDVMWMRVLSSTVGTQRKQLERKGSGRTSQKKGDID